MYIVYVYIYIYHDFERKIIPNHLYMVGFPKLRAPFEFGERLAFAQREYEGDARGGSDLSMSKRKICTRHVFGSALHTPYATPHSPCSILHGYEQLGLRSLHTGPTTHHTAHFTLHTAHTHTPHTSRHSTFHVPHSMHHKPHSTLHRAVDFELHTSHFIFLQPARQSTMVGWNERKVQDCCTKWPCKCVLRDGIRVSGLCLCKFGPMMASQRPRFQQLVQYWYTFKGSHGGEVTCPNQSPTLSWSEVLFRDWCRQTRTSLC